MALATFDRIPWQQFSRRMLPGWHQGQHVSLIGPTGCGKTVLLSELLSRRKYVVFFGTKVYDKSYDDLKRNGNYYRIDSWDEVRPYMNRIMLWPRVRRDLPLRSIYGIQRNAFLPALDAIFHERAWTLVNDELHYMCNQLKLEAEIAMYHHQGRSSHLTNVNGYQRPAHVPLVVYGSSAHAFLWPTNQGDTDLKRLSDFVSNPKELTYNLNKLDRFEFVYVNTVNRSQDPIITKVDLK